MQDGMFLGYKVNTDGLKVCPEKADAVLSLPSPRCLKDVQKLNGKLASLNRFLSKSAEKSLPFFKTLKKCTKKSDFQWTQHRSTSTERHQLDKEASRGASDPKLVKVNRFCKDSEAMVFTLSSRVWKSVSNVPPALGSRRSDCNQVCIKGCIYWWAKDRASGVDSETNVIVFFDLESEKFGQVRLPESLLQTDYWELAEVNDSLVVLANDYDDHDYYDEVRVCGVWIMDFVTKSFTKMFTIKQPTCKWPYHGLFGVLGFRKNGEVIIELEDGLNKSTLEVYEPSSGRINGIGINGLSYTQSVSLY
ncbi:reverse transcriptase domain-containing protein [Tanacetum coccineum]